MALKTLAATAAAAVAFLATTGAAPASAIVSYTFSGPIGNFTYYAPTFLSGNLSVDRISLAHCSSAVITCQGIGLYPDATGVGLQTDNADVVTWSYDFGNATSYFYYDNNDLQHFGVYKDTISGSGLNTLVVARAQQPTPGTVTYNLHNAFLDITFQTYSYIDGTLDVSAANLLDCVSTFVSCTGVTFYGDPSSGDSPSAISDAIAFHYVGGGTSYYYFGEGTLQVPGQYNESFLGDAVLTVTAVPEPASWALLIAGFGLTGGLMRSRRRTGASPAFTLPMA